jgi:hypothetical protein
VIRSLARLLARELGVLAWALAELHSDRGLWGNLPRDS